MSPSSKLAYSFVTLLSAAALAACSANTAGSSSSSSASSTAQSVTTTDAATSTENAASSIDWDSLPTKEVSLTDEGLTITEAGTYVLSGSTKGGVTVKTSGNVRIILAGATISSSDQAAIYVEEAENAVLELREGTQNTVKDGSSHSDSDIEGAIHSKANLTVTGSGQLTLEGNYQDGLVSSAGLTIESGTIKVTAADDGIRGKDFLVINGGTLDVTATGGDGLKATNDEDTSKGYTHITGGSLTVTAADDGIKAESSLVVDDGDITVKNSTEAMEGTNVTINGGKLDLYATDDGINAASDVTGADIFIKITGGTIKVEVAEGDTDAIDSNGNLIMSGGSLDITAQFAFDFDGTSEFTGGTITVNGQTRTEITSDSPGGPGGGGDQGGGRPGRW